MAIKMFDLAGAEPDRRFSPYCWRIKLALMHKGLEFETIPWRFTDKSVIAPYNSERVPVLVDNGRGVADSWTIANYLDDSNPTNLHCSATNNSARSRASTISGPI
jgi:glutathione S-transferase